MIPNSVFRTRIKHFPELFDNEIDIRRTQYISRSRLEFAALQLIAFPLQLIRDLCRPLVSREENVEGQKVSSLLYAKRKRI